MEMFMRMICTLHCGLAVFALLLTASFTVNAQTASSATAILSRTGEVEGVTIHYLKAGAGPAVILLHGYTQNSRMWKPIIPLLAEKFTVIEPDLPGIGDSDIPTDGLDMKTAPSASMRSPNRWVSKKQESSVTISG
jgi:alpha-beta hydrolase superfamily lysophospholipase